MHGCKQGKVGDGWHLILTSLRKGYHKQEAVRVELMMCGEATLRAACVRWSYRPVGGQGVQEGGKRGVKGELEFKDQLLCKQVDDGAAESKR